MFFFNRDTIWDLRLERFECKILAHWSHLTIWNAGKKGRKFYRSLTPENKKKVRTYSLFSLLHLLSSAAAIFQRGATP